MSKLFIVSGVPVPALGSDEDVAIDSTNGTFYTKLKNVWEAKLVLALQALAQSLAAIKASVAIVAVNLDWSLGFIFFKTLSADAVFTFSNLTDGQTITAVITNSATHTATWPGSIIWAGGTPPTLTTGAHTDIFTFTKVGSAIYGSVVQNF